MAIGGPVAYGAGGPTGLWVGGRAIPKGHQKGYQLPRAPARIGQTSGGSGGNGIPAAVNAAAGAQTQQPVQAPAPAPSPLDAQYFQNVDTHQASTNNSVAALAQQRNQDTVSMQAALAQLAYQQPRQSLATEQKANAANQLYSSAYGQRQGDLQYQFAGKQAADVSNYNNQVANIANKIASLQTGELMYDRGQALAATERAATAAGKDTAAGQPTDLQSAPDVPPGPTTAPAAAPAAPAPSLGQRAAHEATSRVNPANHAQWNAAFRQAYNKLKGRR